MKPHGPDQNQISHERVKRVVELFNNAEVSPAEKLIAASEIALAAAQHFRAQAPKLRAKLGAAQARELAMSEVAEAIARMQDAAVPAIHGYNELMRDTEDEPITPL